MSLISIRWDRRAVRELRTLERSVQGRVLDAVDDLAEEPLAGKVLKGPWKGLRRLRVGRHRVIYAFDGRELLISILRVGHRGQVYRRDG